MRRVDLSLRRGLKIELFCMESKEDIECRRHGRRDPNHKNWDRKSKRKSRLARDRNSALMEAVS